jgi:hypothetical protein
MLTRNFPHRPFSRWPTLVHAVLAVVLLLAAWLLGHKLVAGAKAQLQTANETVEVLQQKVQQQRMAALQTPAATAPDFTQSLPGRSVADDVVRDMGRNAVGLGVNLGAVTVVHQEASPRELGKVQFTVTANAEYGRAKAWLAELLARYASLAVQTLSVRAGAGEGGRQEWQLVFTLYVKG